MRGGRLEQQVTAPVCEVLLKVAAHPVPKHDRLDGAGQHQPALLGRPGDVDLLGADASGEAALRAGQSHFARARRAGALHAALPQLLRDCERECCADLVAPGPLLTLGRGVTRLRTGSLHCVDQQVVNPRHDGRSARGWPGRRVLRSGVCRRPRRRCGGAEVAGVGNPCAGGSPVRVSAVLPTAGKGRSAGKTWGSNAGAVGSATSRLV